MNFLSYDKIVVERLVFFSVLAQKKTRFYLHYKKNEVNIA